MSVTIDRKMQAAVPRESEGPIESAARARIARAAAAGAAAIERRLEELYREWDIERTIEVEAASVILLGFGLGAASAKWRILPFFAAGMLLLHNLHGWYPWLPLLRRAGIRTATEIGRERHALKALRGDYEAVPVEADPVMMGETAVRAARSRR